MTFLNGLRPSVFKRSDRIAALKRLSAKLATMLKRGPDNAAVAVLFQRFPVGDSGIWISRRKIPVARVMDSLREALT